MHMRSAGAVADVVAGRPAAFIELKLWFSLFVVVQPRVFAGGASLRRRPVQPLADAGERRPGGAPPRRGTAAGVDEETLHDGSPIRSSNSPARQAARNAASSARVTVSWPRHRS